MAVGFAVNEMNIDLPELFWTYWGHFKGAYVVIGMMIIGTALAGIEKFIFGPRFIATVFAGKFFVFPALAFLFVWLDKTIFHWLTPELHHVAIMMTIVPPAANIAAYAAQMNMEPEKAATTVLIGTVFALFYIPVVIWMIGL